ncbi:MAG: SDR family NAD(P)-dependent oxidoreductase [Candidatus Omnitrophica bacterium]|nr:SDR family NAD(P)-dependent oxidoreductase [Candidatus Omnitrophota bacterium]
MKILVTGGAGFVGSFLVDRLIKSGHKVCIFDNLDEQVHPQGKAPSYLNKEAEFIKGDVRDYEAFEKALKGIEVVFHEAAVVGLAQSLYEIKRYTDVNIGGTANLLDILATGKHSVRKLIIPGSMSSYGEGAYECKRCGKVRPPQRSIERMDQSAWEAVCPHCGGLVTSLPIKEEDALNGTFIYSVTKKNQEEMSLIFGRTYSVPVTVLRYFSGYGPRQALSNPYTGVVAIFLSRLMNNRSPIIYEDGQQVRDYISVHDIVDANLAVLDNKRSDYKVFNVGSGRPITILEIAKKLAQFIDPNIEPSIIGQYRKGDIRHCYPDISFIKKEINWEPRISLEDGFRELFDWSKHEKAVDKFDVANEDLKRRGL